MSQQTLIIVFFILLIDIFVNETLAVFWRQVLGDYIWSVHQPSVIHALGNYEQSTSQRYFVWQIQLIALITGNSNIKSYQ